LGIVLFVIGGSSGFYLHDFYFILVGRALLGLGVAMIMTSSTALIGDYFEQEERHKYLSMQGMAVGVGGITFITTGGFLAELHWSYPFAIYLIPLLFLPYVFMSLYEPHEEHLHEQEIEIDEKRLWPVFATAFFSMVLFYMLPTQLPYLVINQLQGTPSSVGILISVAMSVNAVTSMQYARIKSRLSYAEVYMVTFIVFGIGLTIISQAHTIAQLYFSVFFMGMGFGLILTNTNAWFLSRVQAKQRGKASGILASSFFFGQFFSPIIFEPIVQLIGIQGLFFSVAMGSFIVVFFIKVFK
jgi:MFS family permease